ncbi:uncharacterized protein LOC110374290 [Helicoverpa armigera]|uniref:uncharacterized protein LOC110374290 n=1 Tax=Helicoverpa armigera TaxID=29058 RepID=UPI002111C269|nr:uncharacterized protein LOC110374290 [Helicoverpa armigera]
MAVTRRGYIFGAFLSSLLCVLLIVVALASDSWVVSTATAPGQANANDINYGLFRGEIILRPLITPDVHTLYMTCAPELNACAVSCKTDPEARLTEVRALARGFRPTADCLATTEFDTTNPLSRAPVITFGLYVALIALLIIQLVLAVVAAGLAILNATRNPTEPIFGLPGCLYTNLGTIFVGVLVMLMFGIYWLSSGLNEHLALSYVALGIYTAASGLGFSYWLLLVALLCSVANVVLIQVRAYLLERDPPPPTIKVENHSDGTIFLY